MFRLLVGARRRDRDARNQRMAQAWYTAALGRVKTLPKLETLMTPAKRRDLRQSPREQVAMWQTIAMRFGGTFVPVRPESMHG